MKKHPDDEPVPLHTALWLDNHERIDAMLKPCPLYVLEAYTERQKNSEEDT